jgi:hypothetical protein
MAKYSASVEDRLILPALVGLIHEQEQIWRMLRRVVPAPVPVQLLIDTGSTRCTLLPSVLTRLNPYQLGLARLETSLGIARAALFRIRLEFPHTKLAAIPEFVVARVPLPSSLSAFHGVIGRDLLRRWESFCYQGRRGRLTIRDTRSPLFRWMTG